MSGYQKPEDLIDGNGLLKQCKRPAFPRVNNIPPAASCDFLNRRNYGRHIGNGVSILKRGNAVACRKPSIVLSSQSMFVHFLRRD
ncbi:MAG: hypothetical protein M0R41_15905 [Methylobacter tundripaludum]|uniref:hypothetical protein n=1 Tax=Methylobacter tundripaludum TaxID=173365 RepID=UPI0011B073C4|nr:hypothetical protein [Methylobacter tundripaludum]MCK9637758.1 hypothetical protein [Methylobacter tundripaludum]